MLNKYRVNSITVMILKQVICIINKKLKKLIEKNSTYN